MGHIVSATPTTTIYIYMLQATEKYFDMNFSIGDVEATALGVISFATEWPALVVYTLFGVVSQSSLLR